MRLAKCCFLLLTFPIWLPAEAKCQEERDKGEVKGLVIFLTVHSSLLEAACGLNAGLCLSAGLTAAYQLEFKMHVSS